MRSPEASVEITGIITRALLSDSVSGFLILVLSIWTPVPSTYSPISASLFDCPSIFAVRLFGTLRILSSLSIYEYPFLSGHRSLSTTPIVSGIQDEPFHQEYLCSVLLNQSFLQ